MITIELDESDASTLAMFCHRSIIERVEPFSDSKKEADRMYSALSRLGFKLEKEGFSVR